MPTSVSITSSDNPNVSIGANGTVCAVWHSTTSIGSDIVMSSTQSIASGVWSAPIVIASGAFSHNYPYVAVDVNGNAAVVWYRYNAENFSTLNAIAANLPLNAAAWTIPTLLTNNGLRNPADLFAKIAFDNDGNAIAFYSMSYDGALFDIEAAQKIVGQNWTFGIPLTGPNTYAYQGDVSGNALGEALVGFMLFDGSNIDIQSAETSLIGFQNSLFFSNFITVSAGADNANPKLASTYVASSNTLFAAAVWLDSNGTNTTLQVSTGSRLPVLPPTNLTVAQTANNLGIFTDYTNTLSWQSSASPTVIRYAVFRNGQFVTTVDANTLQFLDHNAIQNGAVTYGLYAIESLSSQSGQATVSFP
jgi:hypothetical protein